MIVEELKILIDWHKYGFKIVGYNFDSLNALSEISILKPNIVLLDINMPNLSGLELAERIKEVTSDTEILFLSAYSQFNYAVKAIDLGAKAYFTKPINRQELIRKLISKKRELDNLNINNILNEIVNENIISNLDVYENKLMNFISFKENYIISYINKEDMNYLEKENTKFIFQFFKGYIVCFPYETYTNKFKINSNLIDNAKNMIDSFREVILKIELLKYQNDDLGDYNQKIINEIIKDIHLRYNEKISLQSYSDKYNVTVSYLSLLFKQSVEETFSSYLINFRLEKAIKLMIETNFSLKAIAISVGYIDYYQFSKIFKKHFKVSPFQYRNRFKNN